MATNKEASKNVAKSNVASIAYSDKKDLRTKLRKFARNAFTNFANKRTSFVNVTRNDKTRSVVLLEIVANDDTRIEDYDTFEYYVTFEKDVRRSLDKRNAYRYLFNEALVIREEITSDEE